MSASDVILTREGLIRLGFFLVTLVVMIGWETAAPRRTGNGSRSARWIGNFGVLAANTLLLRVMFPIAAVGAAALADVRGWGLFNYWDLPAWLSIITCVIALDAAIYLQHVMLHRVPLFWRFHRMHHADVEFDVSTGGRFHPGEAVFSMLFKCAIVIVLGAPLLAVLVFEILLSSTSLFNHSNIRIPLSLDRVLRRVLVTPDMHRVHHSVVAEETNSNFGFNLACWDRLFGTYRAQPRNSHTEMRIGLETFRDPRQTRRFLGMLLIPFTSADPDRYAAGTDS